MNTRTMMMPLAAFTNYKFRNSPFKVLPDGMIWFVSGKDSASRGVVEWCLSQEDAAERMHIMLQSGEFLSLSLSATGLTTTKSVIEMGFCLPELEKTA